jgi:hypothetical protein
VVFIYRDILNVKIWKYLYLFVQKLTDFTKTIHGFITNIIIKFKYIHIYYYEVLMPHFLIEYRVKIFIISASYVEIPGSTFNLHAAILS